MRSRSLPLIAAFALAGQTHAQELEFVGQMDWETEIITGLSGIEVSPDGESFIAVGDRGWWITGGFLRNDDGQISDLSDVKIEPILGLDGQPVGARRVGDHSDAEGLALLPDGRSWVSFERWTRVHGYADRTSPAQFIKDHPTFYDHADNWQLEAVAVDGDGRVFAFSEKPFPEGFPIYRLSPSGWVIDGYLPERDVFAIVGADFAEDGALYLLERKLVVGIWWQNRVRRVRLDGSEDITLWTGERDQFLNLEGLSVWYDNEGLRLTMVSDNNGSRNEKTEFVEFRLTE